MAVICVYKTPYLQLQIKNADEYDRERIKLRCQKRVITQNKTKARFKKIKSNIQKYSLPKNQKIYFGRLKQMIV